MESLPRPGTLKATLLHEADLPAGQTVSETIHLPFNPSGAAQASGDWLLPTREATNPPEDDAYGLRPPESAAASPRVTRLPTKHYTTLELEAFTDKVEENESSKPGRSDDDVEARKNRQSWVAAARGAIVELQGQSNAYLSRILEQENAQCKALGLPLCGALPKRKTGKGRKNAGADADDDNDDDDSDDEDADAAA
ncbi:hypothetical protein PYCC9005_005890 [Savitreella phatthalungensis]